MFKPLLLLSTLLFLGATTQQPSTQPQPAAQPQPIAAIPADAVAKANPVKSTPEHLAHAKKMYGYDCALCHGANGDGKGEVAISMGLKLKDWRTPGTLDSRTDGELFYIISNGWGQMPAEGPPRTKLEDNWHMVNYVRTLAKK